MAKKNDGFALGFALAEAIESATGSWQYRIVGRGTELLQTLNHYKRHPWRLIAAENHQEQWEFIFEHTDLQQLKQKRKNKRGMK